MDARPWLRALRPEARARLFCFGYAGGGSAEMRAFAGDLLPDVDLCPVVLPGREHRFGERAYDDLPALVAALTAALAPVVGLAPYAVYGHSMGAWVGFEWTRALRRARRPLPAHLVVAARRAPHRPARLPPLSALPESAFVAAVQERYGGIPDAIRNDPELMRMFLPTLRADFGLLDRYRYVDEPPLALPITALVGQDDAVEDAADVRAWSEHTSGPFRFERVPGGHFFLRESREELVDRLNAAIRPSIAR